MIFMENSAIHENPMNPKDFCVLGENQKSWNRARGRAARKAANSIIIASHWEALGRVGPPGARFTPFSQNLVDSSGISHISMEIW